MSVPADRPTRAAPSATIPQDDRAAADLAELAGRIRGALDRDGWAWVGHRLEEFEFERVARRLGTIELRTDIVVDPGRAQDQRRHRTVDRDRPGVYQAAGLELHTDRPTAAVLGWYCIRPDDHGGATLLLDTRDILNTFTTEELDGLGRIPIQYMALGRIDGREVPLLAPLVERDGPILKVFFVPWQVQTPSDAWCQHLLARFVRAVRDRAERAVIPVRLEQRQSLFIDNRRMLHGRGPLPPESRRHLVRLYLRTEEGAPPGAAGRSILHSESARAEHASLECENDPGFQTPDSRSR
jgi:hypothetical protein